MPTVTLRVNGREYPDVFADPGVSLLSALRNDLDLTGTKYGCGMGQCGCCTVLVGGEPVRACVTPVTAVVGRTVTTIEGLGETSRPHVLQQAWIEAQASQCGYCQPGQIMEAAALLQQNPSPTDQEIRSALAGHVCRCGTYNRIVDAVRLAAERMRAQPV